MEFDIRASFLIVSFGLLCNCPSFAFAPITSREDVLSKKSGIIYLIGERHNQPKDIEQKEFLGALAREGLIWLGLEGIEAKEEDALVFGLEELATRGRSPSANGSLRTCFI